MLPAFAADLGHVGGIATDGNTTLSPGNAGLVSGKLMCRAFFMGCLTAFSGNLPLLFGIHRRKAAPGAPARFLTLGCLPLSDGLALLIRRDIPYHPIKSTFYLSEPDLIIKLRVT